MKLAMANERLPPHEAEIRGAQGRVLAMTSITGKHLATGSDRVRVAIAGGGIGGMALALSLHAAGLTEVDVYESTRSVMELGVGINVMPHATRELTELGLLEELYEMGIPTAIPGARSLRYSG